MNTHFNSNVIWLQLEYKISTLIVVPQLFHEDLPLIEQKNQNIYPRLIIYLLMNIKVTATLEKRFDSIV